MSASVTAVADILLSLSENLSKELSGKLSNKIAPSDHDLFSRLIDLHSTCIDRWDAHFSYPQLFEANVAQTALRLPELSITYQPQTNTTTTPQSNTLSSYLLENHWHNFALWQLEDQARDTTASDAYITKLKHQIDRENQLRNDAREMLDSVLCGLLPTVETNVPLNSESIGSMIDRLSIVSLKCFNITKQAERPNAPAGHRDICLAKHASLNEQRSDLYGCLLTFMLDLLHGIKRMKIYPAMKMYNDPQFNPALHKDVPANGA